MICLDANIVIAIVSMRNTKLRRRLGEALQAGVQIALPVVALQELRYGFAKSPRREVEERRLEKFLGLGIAILPFEEDDAVHASAIRAAMDVYDTPIDTYDALMAAQACRHGAALATLNKRGFNRVPGLEVTDWSE